MEKKRILMLSIPIIIIVIGVLAYFSGLLSGAGITTGSIVTGQATATGEYDDFAKCLTERGVKMYGAYWCPHCESQKEMFGPSFQYIDYIECDPRGENANPEACQEAGITGYPTWFIDGEKYPGTKSLSRLAELSGCSL